MSIKLYTIGCPKCEVLEKKLNKAGLEYEVCEDAGVMTNLGIDTLPVLQVDDTLLSFTDAVAFVNENTTQEA